MNMVAAFMRANLTLAPVPFIPDIRLYKAHPASGLRRLAQADPAFTSPYWAHYWSGGLALARHLIDQPALVDGRAMLDLGTGSGIVAIAACLAGARQVTATDIDPYAIAATAVNAEANGVVVETVLGDLTASSPVPIDVLTIGDLFYDAATAERVLDLARHHAALGAIVLIGDPLRAHLPLSSLEEVARYTVSEFTGAIGDMPAAVFRLRS